MHRWVERMERIKRGRFCPGMGSYPFGRSGLDCLIRCYNLYVYGGYSSVAERLSVAQDVEGSIPSSRPNLKQ